MGLLKEAKHTQAFAKIGIYGFQGSGKTHTGILIAQGIAKAIGQNKIAFFDTETGSDWWADRLPGKTKLLVLKSSTFADIMRVIRECEQEGIGVLVIDSVTHIWTDLIDEYMRKKKKENLLFHDWKAIKGAWRKYARAFVNSKVHIIACGRAGFEYDMSNMASGEIKKTGTKMKAENEFNFEPHLVIEMESVKTENGLVNVAHVLKDRSDKINGMSFKMPTFKNFEKHFNALNLGGEHVGAVDGSHDPSLFSDNKKGKSAEQVVQEIDDGDPGPEPPPDVDRQQKMGDIV